MQPSPSEEIILAGRVCDQAWQEMHAVLLFAAPELELQARRQMGYAIIDAVIVGERDFDRLIEVARRAVEKTAFEKPGR
jgi:hypothetical protein